MSKTSQIKTEKIPRDTLLKYEKLKDLLQEITDANRHGEVRTEGPYGKEIW